MEVRWHNSNSPVGGALACIKISIKNSFGPRWTKTLFEELINHLFILRHSNCAFFNWCLPVAFTVFVHVSEREIFCQIVENLPYNATEITRFLKTFKIWVFKKKTRWVFRKKTWFSFKNSKGANFLYNVYQMVWFLKNVFFALVA